MNPVFLDSGYIIALESADDQNHQAALEHWRRISKSIPPLITTSYIFSEVTTFFNSRNLHEKAVQIGNRLIKSASIKLVHVGQTSFFEAWNYFVQHQDKKYSFTDCVSFVLMKRFNMRKALSFDKHFIMAGFETLP